MERGSRRASQKACSQIGSKVVGQGVGQREGVKVDWQKLMPPEGFQVLPRRWIVEWTLSWISQNRRMSKDYERQGASGEAYSYMLP